MIRGWKFMKVEHYAASVVQLVASDGRSSRWENAGFAWDEIQTH